MKQKFFKFILVTVVGIILTTPFFASAITVGTIERPPFMMKDEAGNMTGFSIELWQEIAKRAHIPYTLKEFTVFGDMVKVTQKGEVDASIANISITSKREKVLDYSQPIYDSGLQIMVPIKNSAMSLWTLVWESGILKFIGFAILVLLIIAHIVWFFERNVPDKRHDYFRDDYLGGVWDAFWWAFIIMTMGGFENEVPHKISSRIIALVWIVTSLFFISTLTAKITTSLTVSELSSSINSVDDLAGKRVGAMAGPTVRDYLAQFHIPVHEYKTPQALYNALKNGELDAVVGDAPIIQYYATHDGKNDFKLVGEVFKPEKYGILLPEGSRLKERIDQALISIQEDGTYQKILNKYFGTR